MPTINNCMISNFGAGIFLMQSSGSRISNSAATSITNFGIMLSGGNDNLVENSTGASSSYPGIDAYYSPNCTISNSQGISASNAGIAIIASPNTTIINSSGTSTSSSAFYVRASNFSKIINSIGTSISKEGIYLYDNSNNLIVNSNGTSTYSSGISLENSSNNVINNSTGASSASTGISFYGNSSYNQILGSAGISSNGIGIWIFPGGSSNTIASSTGKSTNNPGIIMSGSNHSIINSIGTSFLREGIRLEASTGVQISNSIGSSASDRGIWLTIDANDTKITSSTANSNASVGLMITGGRGNLFANGQISGKPNMYGAVLIGSATNNTIANSTINGGASTYAVDIEATAIGNQLINNTILNATNLVNLGQGTSSNLFYWNNFTATSGYYIRDLGSGNSYNTTINGKQEGNIYANVMSGAVQVQGNVSSAGFPSLYIGMNGTGYPYNAANSQGKIAGSAVDYAPLTPNYFNNSSAQGCGCGVLNMTNYMCNVTQDLNSTGTCFTVQASNVTIQCNGHSITGSNVTTSNGIYSNKPSTTVKNCVLNNYGTGVYFYGVTQGSISNTTVLSALDAGYRFDSVNLSMISDSSSSAALGVHLQASPNNTLANVRANGTTVGIEIVGSNYNTVSGSSGIRNGGGNNGAGIVLYASQYNVIANSTGIAVPLPGIWLAGGSNNNILFNFTGISDSFSGIEVWSGVNNTIANSRGASSNVGYGISFLGGTNNTIINSLGESNSDLGISLFGSNYSTITNTTGTSNYSGGIALYSGFGNIISNSTAKGAAEGISIVSENGSTVQNSQLSAESNAALFLDDANDNVIANSTINGTGAIAVKFDDLSLNTNNVLIGNTLISTNTHVLFNVGSGNNSFYWNNFTNTAGDYIQDLNGGNIFNTTINGKPEGNIYANVMSGAVQVQGNVSSAGFPSLYIGMNGTGYPYSASTAQGKIIGSAVDYAPLTPYYFNNSSGQQGCQCGNLNASNYICNVTSDLTATVNCFVVHASNVTIECNGHKITKTTNASQSGVGVESDSNDTKVRNCAFDQFSYGVSAGADRLVVEGSAINATNAGIFLYHSLQALIWNNTITGQAYTGIDTNLASGTIANNTISVYGKPISLYSNLGMGGPYYVYNNTLATTSGSSGLVSVTFADSSLFYWNTFTATSGYYLYVNSNGVSLNTTINGKQEGNIYANVMDGNVQVQGNLSSVGFPQLFVGTNGSGVPYNNTTSQGKIVVAYGDPALADYAPLTPYYYNTAPQQGCQCGNLNVPNYVCNVTQDLNSTGTCFTVQASNVTIQCNGHMITGNNSIGTYGIYSSAANTVVNSCNVSNFMHGIYFNGAQGGQIIGTNSSTVFHQYIPGTGRYIDGNGIFLNGTGWTAIADSKGKGTANGILVQSGSHNSISNSLGDGSYVSGIYLNSTDENTITNSAGLATDPSYSVTGVQLEGSDSNTLAGVSGTGYGRGISLRNSNLNSIAGSSGDAIGYYGEYGLELYFSSNNTVTDSNGTIHNGGASYEISNSGILLYSAMDNSLTRVNGKTTGLNDALLLYGAGRNTIKDSAFATGTCTGNCLSATGIELKSGSTANILANNTMVSPGIGVHISDTGSSGNAFYWNNFTSYSAYYVFSGTNAANSFNASVGGRQEGNIWGNVMDGSVNISGMDASIGFPDLYVGTNGSAYPYRTSVSLGKIIGNVTDYAPLTPYYLNMSAGLPAPEGNNSTANNTTASDALALGTNSLPGAYVGAEYSVILKATGGTGNYKLGAKGLPDGLEMREHAIAGVPKQEGKFLVTIAVDDGSASVESELVLVVYPKAEPKPDEKPPEIVPADGTAPADIAPEITLPADTGIAPAADAIPVPKPLPDVKPPAVEPSPAAAPAPEPVEADAPPAAEPAPSAPSEAAQDAE
ncbi:MAG: right-handed parallel beta-helix repeat-containing protein [Candidatus Micrarchaeota archaeon]|nr:right-handed parallel beta-helix repeat-containing protein [Candidatus Micrarchaeota archaeon]